MLDGSGAAERDIAACRRLLRTGSRSFFAASLLLPPRVRAPASALYAFCRLADDAVDIDGGQLTAVERLRVRLDKVYRGCPIEAPADRALTRVVEQFDLPYALPAALLDGLEWDARGRRYESMEDLCAYAARVAGSVGAMMALIMGIRASAIIARACDLGVAMQLTNIARDVGEDARAGRIYLPLAWMREAGIDPGRWLALPRHGPSLALVTGRVLDTAERLYRRSHAGIGGLPAACRPGIHAARLLYREIGVEVARRGYDSVTQRAIVPRRRQCRLLASALCAATAAHGVSDAEPLEQTRYLVEAVMASGRATRVDAQARTSRAPALALGRRVVWVIELFERLERREQIERSG